MNYLVNPEMHEEIDGGETDPLIGNIIIPLCVLCGLCGSFYFWKYRRIFLDKENLEKKYF